ncbi:MAG: 3-isopropylmalate dehydrogenase [Micromonosporaceae bacterium]|nr:3-isopropylmalate dehydrogenase [Micromonosporaceae bacterium]
MGDYVITALPGDGVGPEITEQAVDVLLAVTKLYGHHVTVQHGLVGNAAIAAEGVAISESTLAACAGSDALLFGAVGGPPASADPDAEARPEQALMRLRKGFEFFANLRPVRPAPSMVGASTLKPQILDGTDLVFVRELSAGLYYGHLESAPRKPSEIHLTHGGLEAVDTLLYTEQQIERVVRVAFDLAEQRRGRVTSVDKANVLSSSVLWRRIVERVAADHPAVTCEHLLVDACAMQLLRSPSRFDVLVTENLFGDILTDEAAMLTGSIGMLPSASLGTRRTASGLFGLYEPIHGSAPDLAGQDRANPIGAIASVALLLRHSLGLEEEAAAVEAAVERVLDQGYRTVDIQEAGTTVVGTREMGERIVELLPPPPAIGSPLEAGTAVPQSDPAAAGSRLQRQRLLVRQVRDELLGQYRGRLADSQEPPIRVMARIVQDLERECALRQLDQAAVGLEIVNRTIGDVNLRLVTECEGAAGGPGDYRRLADEVGIALPGEALPGHTATGEVYQWLRRQMLDTERQLLARGWDLRMYDIAGIGNPVLREWLAGDLARWGLSATAAHVALGLGATGCVDHVLRGLAARASHRGAPAGAVLFALPGFNMPEGQAAAYGYRCHRVPTLPANDFKLTARQLDQALAEHGDLTAVYLIITNNPTTFAYTPEELEGLLEVLRSYRQRGRLVHLLADLAYVGTGVPADDAARMRVLGTSDLVDQMIFISSLSKTHTLTGERFGWVTFGDPDLARALGASWVTSVGTLPAEWQLRFMAYHRLFRENPWLVEKIRNLYRLRRTQLRAQLQRFDEEYQLFDRVYLDDDATIYNWSRLRAGQDCFSVFGTTGLAGIPGSTFGYSDEYIRFSVGMLPVAATG